MDVSVTCPVPAAHAWQVATDLALWPDWGPSVSAVEPPHGSVEAGMSGRVRTPLGLWLPFTVDRVDPGRRWNWRIGPVQATGHRVDPVDEHSCRLVIEVPLWAAAYGAVCLVALRRLSDLAITRLDAQSPNSAAAARPAARPENRHPPRNVPSNER